jgi:Heparinase II/III-like protein
MNYKQFALYFTILLCIGTVKAQDHKDLLKNKITRDLIEKSILPVADWKPFPPAGKWTQIPDSIKQKYIKEGEALLDTKWESVPATSYLEFAATGKRANDKYLNAIPEGLSTLVMAELFENKGRFIPQMIDCIWTACEMSLWANASSPLFRSEDPQKLPDISNGKLPIVDLHCGKISGAIAWAHYFFKDQFDLISPVINKRIKEEINRRILTPCLERSDFFWMGYDGRIVNNWNPWINSNWLICTLLMEDNIQRRNKSIVKIVESSNFFLNGYQNDGGCDEGSTYWSQAPGSLFEILQLLNSASANRINLFHEKIISKMGLFISQMYIANERFVNYADASSRVKTSPGLVYNYGQTIGDSVMMKFGSYLLQKDGGYISGHINRVLWGLASYPEIVKVEPHEPMFQDSWFPDLQIMTARHKNGSNSGFYITVKGGVNGGPHSHNDVGNFMLFYNGNPILVDAGVGVYSGATFGPGRYKIWTMQSAYHNLPTINGEMQRRGDDSAAKNVKYSHDSKIVHFGMDIAETYPKEACVKIWNRNITFNRAAQTVEIDENFELTKFVKPTELNFLVYSKPVIDQVKGIIYFGAESKSAVMMFYDPKQLNPTIEMVKMDSKITAAWGEKLYRLKLTLNNSKLKNKVQISFTKGKI